MATDLSTANVVDTKSGTGWTITVTACNLLSDLSIKDFVVLIAGSLSPNSNFTKTSQTVLTYNGTSIASSTVEVRRVTPQNRFQEITFAEKLSSTVFNEEIDRIIRKAYEYTLNGIGPGSTATIQTPLDDVYSATWNGDTIRPATRNALYDKIELLGDLADDEAITGNWTAPTQTDGNNSTRLATTAYTETHVTNELANSPALGGNPTAATQASDNDSTRIATTAYTRTAVTDVLKEHAFYATITNEVVSGTLQDTIEGYTETFDQGSNFNPSLGSYTAPVAGIYTFTITINNAVPSAGTMSRLRVICVFGGSSFAMHDLDSQTATRFSYSGSIVVDLAANDTVNIDTLIQTSGGANSTISNAIFSGYRLFSAT